MPTLASFQQISDLNQNITQPFLLLALGTDKYEDNNGDIIGISILYMFFFLQNKQDQKKGVL